MSSSFSPLYKNVSLTQAWKTFNNEQYCTINGQNKTVVLTVTLDWPRWLSVLISNIDCFKPLKEISSVLSGITWYTESKLEPTFLTTFSTNTGVAQFFSSYSQEEWGACEDWRTLNEHVTYAWSHDPLRALKWECLSWWSRGICSGPGSKSSASHTMTSYYLKVSCEVEVSSK